MTSNMRNQFEVQFENFIKDLDRECADAEAERWKRKKKKARKKTKEMPLDIRHG